jgi:enoyl-CoA hydratase/carnithine racemase
VSASSSAQPPAAAPTRRIQAQESRHSLHLTISPPLEAAALAELSHFLENWTPSPTLCVLVLHLALAAQSASSPQGSSRDASGSKALHETRQGRVRERALIVAQERALAALHKISAPLLGVAVGAVPPAGCALLSACDLLLAAEDAVFSANGGAAALAYRAPAPRLGSATPPAEHLSAYRAYRQGLLTWIAPKEQITAEVDRIARLLQDKPPAALALARRALLLGMAHQSDPAQALEQIGEHILHVQH